jgi:dTDP-glucose 4,6-dehydratase
MTEPETESNLNTNKLQRFGANRTMVVIGSNSFSGASFIRTALAQDFHVIGMSRSQEAEAVFLPYRWDSSKLANYEFHQLDLNHDVKQIIDIIKGRQAQFVVNFAAQSMVAESWLYPEHWYQTNLVANSVLHNHLRRFDFLEKYVHVSTPEVYGNCEGYVDENTILNPSTPYAVSRAACDMHLKSFFKNYGFPVAFTRAANVYGPGQQLYRIIPRTILCIKSGQKLQLHGGGHSVRSFIHIQDVADATLLVATKSNAGEIFHLSTSNPISIRKLVEKICHKLSVQFEDIVEITEDRPGKDSAYLLDSTKARAKLGWQDLIDLDSGIEETITWFESNWEALRTQSINYKHKP